MLRSAVFSGLQGQGRAASHGQELEKRDAQLFPAFFNKKIVYFSSKYPSRILKPRVVINRDNGAVLQLMFFIYLLTCFFKSYLLIVYCLSMALLNKDTSCSVNYTAQRKETDSIVGFPLKRKG